MGKYQRRGIALLTLGVVAVQQVGCTMPLDHERSVSETTQALEVDPADGERLFRELLFPNAEVAKRAPALERLYDFSGLASASEEQRKAIGSMQDLLLSGVAELDPSFFERFAKSVRSGDVLEVDASLQEASGLLHESLRHWNGTLESALSDEGLAELDKRLAEDPRLRELAKLASLDRDVIRKLAEIMREYVTPLPDDSIRRVPIVTVQVQRPPVLDAQFALDMDLAQIRQIIVPKPPLLDVNLNRATQTFLQTPHTAIDVRLAKSAQLQIAHQAALDFQSDLTQVGDVTVDVETAIYAVAVVAVAVVAVVVLVFGAKIGERAEYLNGENTQLFRDQLIADVTRGYAR